MAAVVKNVGWLLLLLLLLLLLHMQRRPADYLGGGGGVCVLTSQAHTPHTPVLFSLQCPSNAGPTPATTAALQPEPQVLWCPTCQAEEAVGSFEELFLVAIGWAERQTREEERQAIAVWAVEKLYPREMLGSGQAPMMAGSRS